jgi:hypothetical protein
VHQIFQIKYAPVDNFIRNKLPHRSFSKFKIEFELKNQGTDLSLIWLHLNCREFGALEFDGICHARSQSHLDTIGTWVQ